MYAAPLLGALFSLKFIAILVKDRLYFMGGNFSVAGSGNVTDRKSLHWLQMNESFPVDGLLNDEFLHTTSSSETQFAGGGAFWTNRDGSRLYSMAGFPDNTVNGQSNINAYIPQYDNWESIKVSGGPFNKLNRLHSMSAFSSDGGGSQSFIAGGRNWLPGLVTFDSTNTQSPSWTNITDGIPYFWGPTTQYVRFGKQGVLVSIGGYEDFSNQRQREMSSIQIYDIDSKKWSEVVATGDIPKPRSEFCSVLSAAPDDSSFQMTIYGGWSHADNYALKYVYVLTMPAFHWVKINDTGNAEVKLAKNVGRRGHHCNAYNDRQMIVLGGSIFEGGESFDMTSCNESYPAVKLLDTTTFEWQTQFPLANSTYQVPSSVYEIIGGGPNGGAQPANTWQKGSNLDLFSRTIPRYNPDKPNGVSTKTNGREGSSDGAPSSSSSSLSTGTPPSNPSSSSTARTSTGVIAGGVVGGIAGLGLIGAMAYFFILWRRKARRMTNDWVKPELSSDSSPPPWVNTQPNYHTHEVLGDHGVDKLKPREMDAEALRRELNGWNGVEAPYRETAHELPGGVGRR